ncbi:MAG: cobalamin-binding protein, partial [Chloroflexaceae bacterium]|nr:cobalamin-binding protein [Chloroflexaceae bacterium]
MVAVTHECDYPPDACTKPVITSSTMPHTGLSSAQIDAIVSAQVREQLSIYHLDATLLHQLQPTLILTQALCEVCAVAFDQVRHAVRDLGGEPRILSLEPTTLDGIFETIEMVGAVTGCTATAQALTSSLRERVATVQQR